MVTRQRLVLQGVSGEIYFMYYLVMKFIHLCSVVKNGIERGGGVYHGQRGSKMVQ